MINEQGYAEFETETGPSLLKVVLGTLVVIIAIAGVILWSAGVFDEAEPVTNTDKFIHAVAEDEEGLTDQERTDILSVGMTYCVVYDRETVSEAQQFLIAMGLDEGQALVFGTAARTYLCGETTL
ncbi:hypothetical protein SEA_KEELAN_64 [Gordonia phage Keelan]|nr:hypothetical protein SEA_KEELAN_64 [Gordonia phage Keelan]